jgi:hypothetical protein
LSSSIDVGYDVWNSGKYDLSGIKLHVRLWIGATNYDFTPPDFSLSQGQHINNSHIVFDVFPNHIALGDYAEIIGVDMDKPTD